MDEHPQADTPQKGRAILSVDLRSPDLKARWLTRCQQVGQRPSEGIRILVNAALGVALPAPKTSNLRKREAATVAIEVKLSESEATIARELAQASGFSLARWVVSLVRTRVSDTAPLGQAELEGLARATHELHKAGVNLNQIAHQMNMVPEQPQPTLADVICVLSREIKEQTKAVKAVLDANAERWGLK